MVCRRGKGETKGYRDPDYHTYHRIWIPNGYRSLIESKYNFNWSSYIYSSPLNHGIEIKNQKSKIQLRKIINCMLCQCLGRRRPRPITNNSRSCRSSSSQRLLNLVQQSPAAYQEIVHSCTFAIQRYSSSDKAVNDIRCRCGPSRLRSLHIFIVADLSPSSVVVDPP